MPIITAGEPAPEFTLATYDGKPFTRAGLEGRTTVLVFYPFAFSPVCTEQLSLYNEVLDEFEARGATLYGVSCDAVWSQKAFKESLGVDIEQLSDFEPKGAACRAPRGPRAPPRRPPAAPCRPARTRRGRRRGR